MLMTRITSFILFSQDKLFTFLGELLLQKDYFFLEVSNSSLWPAGHKVFLASYSLSPGLIRLS